MGKTKLAVFGAGGHGKVVAQIAISIGYDEIIFIDDFLDTCISWDAFISIHGIETPIALGVGSNHVRKKLYHKLKKTGCNIATLVDKSAMIAQDATIGEGTVIMPGVIVNTETIVGKGVILNSGSVIEHECCVGAFAHISPNVSLAGGVGIGDTTHIGIGASVIQNISIGENVIVGAGSVVVHDIASHTVEVGNPSRYLRDNVDEA